MLPNSTQRIDREGFRYCTSLSNITLSNSLNYINEYAFADCPVLNNLALPESLKSIQNAAFNNDAALSSISFPAALEGIGAAAFANCTSLKEVVFNTTHYNMTIGADAFKSSNAINKVKVAHLDSWVSINFSNPDANPVSISHRLYNSEGSEFIDAEVPEGPTYVNNNVFYNCQNLKSVTLPSSIQIINDNIFYGCTSLTRVMSKATTPPSFIGTDDPAKMNNVFNAADLYVPDASVSSYSSDDWWKRFKNIYKLQEQHDDPNPAYQVGTDITNLAPAEWEGKTGVYEKLANPAPERYTDAAPKEIGDILTQTMNGLRNGTYKVQLDVAASFTSGRGFVCPTGNGLSVVFANETQRNLSVVEREWVYEGEQKIVTLTATVTDGTLKYGIKNLAPSGNWFVARLRSVVYVSESQQSPQAYAVSITADKNGTTTTDVEADEEGSRVFITATPDEDCTLESIKVTTTGGQDVEVTKNSFIMPASAVVVTATYVNPYPYKVGDDITDFAPTEWVGKTGVYEKLANQAPERYTNAAPEEVGDILTQTMTGLRNGTYKVQLDVTASFTSGRGFVCPTGNDLSVVFANETQRNLSVVEREWVYEGEQKIVNLTATVTDGTLKYGIKNLAPSGNWFVARLRSIVYVSKSLESPQTYAISVTTSENGTTMTDVEADEEGSRVFITATPDEDCTLESIRVTTTGGQDLEVTKNSFIMSASAVVVTAIYNKPEPNYLRGDANNDGSVESDTKSPEGKVFRNGSVIIIHDGKEYTPNGTPAK